MSETATLANPLESSDRAMRCFEGSEAASALAEDSLLEAEAAPALRDDSRRQRRWLVLSSVVTLLISLFDLKPKGIPALDLDLAGARESVILLGAGAFTLYLLVEFFTFARRDDGFWRRRVRVARRRLHSSLEAQRCQAPLALGRSSMTDQTVAEVDELISAYLQEPQVARRSWIVDLATTLPGWVEVLVPILIALVSLGALVCRLLA